MKIAQLLNNFRRVTPTTNNAIYSHAALLTNGLVERDHGVTLFASGDSETKARLESVTAVATGDLELSERLRRHYASLLISKCYQEAVDYDIVHSHLMLLGSFCSRLVGTPTVQSMHVPIDEELKPILKEFKDNYYISFSHAQRQQMPELNWIANIYHGLDLQEFQFNPEPQDYLLYLSRINAEKGTHLAIEAAKAAKVPLIIAGRSYEDGGYWHNFVEKHIDGKQVKYVGEANYKSKKELLKNAKALLFPSQVSETFGLSMIEAMACGTPVIGWDIGSIPEVIQEKETGYVVKSVAGMTKAIKAIDKISRQATRARAENFFSVEKMVTGYERVYARVIEDSLKKHKKNGKKK